MENLFKHNIFFTPFNEHFTDYISISNFTINVIYVSNTIYNVKKLGIRDVDGLIDKIGPFLYYLASKYQEKNKENNFYDAFFSMSVSFDISNSFVIVNHFAVLERVNKDIFLENSFKVTQICPALNGIFSKPFQISISLRVDIYQEIEIMEFQEYETDEDKDEDEEEPIINIEKSFKYDECIICLTNQPNVFFCNCGHIAICEECDKMKTLNTCPICKTKITIKRIVE